MHGHLKCVFVCEYALFVGRLPLGISVAVVTCCSGSSRFLSSSYRRKESNMKQSLM